MLNKEQITGIIYRGLRSDDKAVVFYFLLFRIVLVFGVALRVSLHKADLVANGMIYYQNAAIGIYVVYIILVFIATAKKGRHADFDLDINIQIWTDAIFGMLFYGLTLNFESDTYMFFIFPIALMSFRQDADELWDLIWGVLLAIMLFASALFIYSHIRINDTVLIYKNFIPRMLFMGFIYYISKVFYHTRRREQEMSYEKSAILNSIGEKVFAIDIRHKVRWANDRFIEDYEKKYKKKYEANMICYRDFRGQKTKCPTCQSIKAMSDGGVHTEDENWNENGKITTYKVTAAPLKNKKGEIVGAVETLLNITKEKIMQENIRKIIEKRSLLMNIINSAVDTILVTDTTGKIIISNAAACKLLGYNSNEMTNKKSREIYYDPKGERTGYDIAVEVRSILYQQKEIVLNYETCFISSDNEVIPISLSAALLRNESGEIIGAVGVGHDMRAYNKLNEDKLLNEQMSLLNQQTVSLRQNNWQYELFLLV